MKPEQRRGHWCCSVRHKLGIVLFYWHYFSASLWKKYFCCRPIAIHSTNQFAISSAIEVTHRLCFCLWCPCNYLHNYSVLCEVWFVVAGGLSVCLCLINLLCRGCCGSGFTRVCEARGVQGGFNKALISDMTDTTITHGILTHEVVLFRWISLLRRNKRIVDHRHDSTTRSGFGICRVSLGFCTTLLGLLECQV